MLERPSRTVAIRYAKTCIDLLGKTEAVNWLAIKPATYLPVSLPDYQLHH
jgi:hypothetical protein